MFLGGIIIFCYYDHSTLLVHFQVPPFLVLNVAIGRILKGA